MLLDPCYNRILLLFSCSDTRCCRIGLVPTLVATVLVFFFWILVTAGSFFLCCSLELDPRYSRIGLLVALVTAVPVLTNTRCYRVGLLLSSYDEALTHSSRSFLFFFSRHEANSFSKLLWHEADLLRILASIDHHRFDPIGIDPRRSPSLWTSLFSRRHCHCRFVSGDNF